MTSRAAGVNVTRSAGEWEPSAARGSDGSEGIDLLRPQTCQRLWLGSITRMPTPEDIGRGRQ